MKRKGYLLLLAVSLLFAACSKEIPERQTVYETDSGETLQTVPKETQPLHSVLYHPDYTPEQIQEYFAEVVLDMEYSDGTGDVTRVQKWLMPIGYRIDGTPTQEDLAVLNDLFAGLNEIPGFPGFYAAEAEGQENLIISFLSSADFRTGFSEAVNGEDAYGATQFWYYTDNNEIHTARIGCRTDISQQERNSVVVEEIINTLGISDTLLREDSITYQHSNENTALSQVDWIILKLLYDPRIQCGMGKSDCMAVLSELYY